MPADFTPFFASVQSRLGAANRPTSGGTTPPFAPVHSSDSAAVPGAAKSALPLAGVSSHRPVTIETKRDGDRISQIRVQCRCGEVIEIDCEY